MNETTQETTSQASAQAAPAETAAPVQASSADFKYSLEDLKINSKVLFGVQPEVIDGALYGNNCKQFTVAEMTQLIQTFQNKEAK